MSSLPNKRKYDPLTAGLDEIIQCKKNDGVDFSIIGSNSGKRSKWERYKDSDSDHEDEDEDDFVRAHISESGESGDSEVDEEPISIPLHGGCDDDTFFHTEGASVSNIDGEDFSISDQEHITNEGAYAQLARGRPLSTGTGSGTMLTTSSPSLQYEQDLTQDNYSHYDGDEDDEPIDILSRDIRIKPGPQVLMKMKMPTDKRLQGMIPKRFQGQIQDDCKITKPIKRIGSVNRGSVTGINVASAGMRKKTTRLYDSKTDMEVEEITVSDDETPAAKVDPVQYRKEMSNLDEVLTEEIKSKDCAGRSLNDIIQKAKLHFSGSSFNSSIGSNSSFNNSSFNSSFSPSGTPSKKGGVHGCPVEIVKQRLNKYWNMRYDLFSKFDDGIQLDEESWYSVTPEVIAKRIAQRCKIPNGIIIDAFCGCGGNSIQFAKVMKKVIAVDIDPVKIEYAKNNARIYGVLDKIQFVVGDFMELASVLKADVVFLSPPWGGPSYLNAGVFDLRTMIPMGGFKVFELAQSISPNIAYFVPRTTSHGQLQELAEGSPVEVEDNVLKGRKITYTAYFGDLVAVNGDDDE